MQPMLKWCGFRQKMLKGCLPKSNWQRSMALSFLVGLGLVVWKAKSAPLNLLANTEFRASVCA